MFDLRLYMPFLRFFAFQVEDTVRYRGEEYEDVEDHRSIILALLSQLKLGMDLTKVELPAFVLEKRSLLETIADTMAHPQLFMEIPDLQSAEERMIAVIKWYLSSFHASRKVHNTH